MSTVFLPRGCWGLHAAGRFMWLQCSRSRGGQSFRWRRGASIWSELKKRRPNCLRDLGSGRRCWIATSRPTRWRRAWQKRLTLQKNWVAVFGRCCGLVKSAPTPTPYVFLWGGALTTMGRWELVFFLFGAHGATVMYGCRTGMTVQITEKHALFSIEQHCIAHKLKLAWKSLSYLLIF